MNVQTVSVSDLSLDILLNELHLPLVDGKANREKIEDAITIWMLKGDIGYVDEGTVNLAIGLIDDIIVEYRVQ
jgi:hypothetical protein